MKEKNLIQKRYNRISPIYDTMEGIMERARFSPWRKLLWDKVEGQRILEVGVGTGKNFPNYPGNVVIHAMDFSEGMLARARKRAREQHIAVRMQLMDVQHLGFKDDIFDTVVDSFVFCSVPDPVRGLEEIHRVCRPGGKVIMLEHVLSTNRILASLMNLLNPLTVRIVGANINRKTVETVAGSGLLVENVTDLSMGIFKLIEARKG